MQKLYNVVFILLISLILCMMVVGFFSCTTTKDVTKTVTKVDSTSIKSLTDSVRLLTSEKQRLEEEIRELTYSGVIFDTVTIHDTVNQVIIKPDGTIEAKGNIKSASFSSDKLTKRISELQRDLDSLRLVKEKVRTEYKYITERKYKDRKTVLFPWYLLIIAAAATVFYSLIKKSKL